MTKQSGKRAHVSMRHGCDARLRNAYDHWARVSTQIDPHGKARCRALRQRGHTHGRALRSVAALQAAEVDRRLRFPEPFKRPRHSVSLDGSSLHAGVHIHANDLQGRERPCRSAVRPPFALHRLSSSEDGRLVYRMRRPGGGSLFLRLTPDELLARLATLVPPPRIHSVRWHGAASAVPTGKPPRTAATYRLPWAGLRHRGRCLPRWPLTLPALVGPGLRWPGTGRHPLPGSCGARQRLPGHSGRSIGSSRSAPLPGSESGLFLLPP